MILTRTEGTRAFAWLLFHLHIIKSGVSSWADILYSFFRLKFEIQARKSHADRRLSTKRCKTRMKPRAALAIVACLILSPKFAHAQAANSASFWFVPGVAITKVDGAPSPFGNTTWTHPWIVSNDDGSASSTLRLWCPWSLARNRKRRWELGIPERDQWFEASRILGILGGVLLQVSSMLGLSTFRANTKAKSELWSHGDYRYIEWTSWRLGGCWLFG